MEKKLVVLKEYLMLVVLIPVIAVVIFLEDLFEKPDPDGSWEVATPQEKQG